MTQNADTSQEKAAPAHTPAPWTIEPMENWEKVIRITNDGDGYARLYVEVCRDDCDTEVAEANAHLIAAAPEMLASLNSLWSGVSDFRRKALIDPNGQTPDDTVVHAPVLWGTLKKIASAIAKAEKP